MSGLELMPAPAILATAGWTADRNPHALAAVPVLAGYLAGIAGTVPRQIGDGGMVVPAAGLSATLAACAPAFAAAREALAGLLDQGDRPLVVANRCAAAIGYLPAVFARHPDACLLWLDAHGDLNTPGTSASGYIGGMVLTALAGQWRSGQGAGLAFDRLVLAGARDLDPAEAALIDTAGITTVPAGADGGLDPAGAIAAIAGRPLWVHVDLDVHAPGVVSTEYSVAGGPSADQTAAFLAAVLATAPLVGADIAELEYRPDRIARDLAAVAIVAAPLLAALAHS
ncbi:hypothetical protein GCM10011505_45560 [Tistrella bauzanensis]|uniref:Arginase n=2 Tax=Tistrella bauzanensis TaxID=657419 RepID=A0ABQ1J7Y4_9PROT|nr:hypothetical protein GCM10011505_45560 [Tistrella bauzanensis]